MEKIFRNRLESVNEHGELDWRPGLGGQRSNRLATPLLASIAWKIYLINENTDFLLDIFPKLVEFFFAWFSGNHDRDQDEIPEWDHPLQAGFEDHPLFARWHDWAQGLDITKAESPSLCAFLYRESQVILRISGIIGNDQFLNELELKSDFLRSAVEGAWNERLSGYYYWDRDSHTSSERVILGQLKGSGSIKHNQSFSEPQRIVFQIKSASRNDA